MLWVDLFSLQPLSGMRTAARNGCPGVPCQPSWEPRGFWSPWMHKLRWCSCASMPALLSLCGKLPSPPVLTYSQSQCRQSQSFWFLTAPKLAGSLLKLLLWQCNFSVSCGQHAMARQLPVLSQDSRFDWSCQLLISRDDMASVQLWSIASWIF